MFDIEHIKNAARAAGPSFSMTSAGSSPARRPRSAAQRAKAIEAAKRELERAGI